MNRSLLTVGILLALTAIFVMAFLPEGNQNGIPLVRAHAEVSNDAADDEIQEQCPDVSAGERCAVTGEGAAPEVTVALGKALAACEVEMAGCPTQEQNELARKRAECEVSNTGEPTGCILRYSETSSACAGDLIDCSPPMGVEERATYRCYARGLYDIYGYTCTRPAEPEPAPGT